MADDSKKDIKSSGNANVGSNAGNTNSNNSSKDNSKPVTTPVTAQKSNSSQNKGGEQSMAKDPEGMFDYSNCQTYTVKEGDNLFDVAQKGSVALQQLRYFNHINKATLKIKVGQVLYIPKNPVTVPTGE